MTFWKKLSFLQIQVKWYILAIMKISTQSIYVFMEQIRRQKTMKYKENLGTKLFFQQNDKNALTTFLHSHDVIFLTTFQLFYIFHIPFSEILLKCFNILFFFIESGRSGCYKNMTKETFQSLSTVLLLKISEPKL